MQDKNTSSNRIRGYVILAVVLVAFAVISFVAPFEKTWTFWMAFAFGIIAIVYQVFVFRLSFSEDGDAKSRFYWFPIARVGATYLIIQLVISLVEMILSGIIPMWLAVIINILPLAYALIGCVASDAMREEIKRQDTKLMNNVENMRNLQSISASIVSICTDEAAKKQLKNVADEFKYSDPVSSDKTVELEIELQNQLQELQNIVLEKDYGSVEPQCARILANLSERNRICGQSKQ